MNRYRVIEEKLVGRGKNYAVTDTTTNTVLARFADKRQAEDVCRRANERSAK
jgi:hypothetical protein